MGALAVVGVVGSYSRASLVAVAFGVAFALLIVFAGGAMSPRRKLALAGAAIAIVGATYGGLLVASQGSPQLRERAAGVLDPLGDRSVRLRFETWSRTLEAVADRPLGQGVGAVGAASAPVRERVLTTDNSFLKVLVEQGVIGFVLFAGGMLGAVAVLTRRLRGGASGSQAPGIAALAGFVTFLAVAVTGESVEQPGKVLAWGLLGAAAAHAFAGSGAAPASEPR